MGEVLRANVTNFMLGFIGIVLIILFNGVREVQKDVSALQRDFAATSATYATGDQGRNEIIRLQFQAVIDRVHKLEADVSTCQAKLRLK